MSADYTVQLNGICLLCSPNDGYGSDAFKYKYSKLESFYVSDQHKVVIRKPPLAAISVGTLFGWFSTRDVKCQTRCRLFRHLVICIKTDTDTFTLA